MNRPIRVLFANPFADLSGPEVVVVRLLAGLDQTRFAAGLVCPGEGRLAKAARANGIDMGIVPLRSATFTRGVVRQALVAVGAARELAALIRHRGYDIVHVNSHRIGPVCTLAARRAGVPIVWHIHEIYETTPLRRRIIVELVRRLPDAIVAVSDAVSAQFAPSAKLRRIYNGIDAVGYAAQADREAARQEFGFGPQNVVVGCMGRLSAQKGQDWFLRAARSATTLFPNARFLVVGDEALGDVGFRERLESLTQELGLIGQVRFTGYRGDAASMVAAMDLFVHPALIPDSLPNVILEAMALSKPVVASATGGTPELVTDGRTGLLVPPGDVTALARGINRLIAEPELARRMGEAGRRRVVERFAWQDHIRQFEALYEELATRRPRR